MQPDMFFQDMLTAAGGTNPYGEPMFRFAWSGDETYRISNGSHYQNFLIATEPIWMLMKWEPAEFWGTREEWEWNNREPNGLMTAGEYPWQGRYRVLKKLLKHVIVNGAMTFNTMPLSTPIVTQLLPMLKGFLELSYAERANLIMQREVDAKEKLMKQFGASRELYRGIATQKQIKQKEEAIDRFLRDPKRIKKALQTKRRLN